MQEAPAAESAARAALSAYLDPYIGRTFGEAKTVSGVTLRDGVLAVELKFGFPVGDYARELGPALQRHLGALLSGARLQLTLRSDIEAHAVQRTLKPLANVKNIVAVASGKGGVGKSTTAANLAIAWAHQGAKVGLLDADIYGPSQPLMMGLAGRKPGSTDGKHIQPLSAHGVAVMSIGFLIDAAQPMAWRGPMVTQALTQLLADTDWGELDYLVVDMPPGTGDIQLTLAQRVPVSGAVIVTTPQDIALLDARKGVNLFEKVGVPILGIVENMAVHVCTHCGHVEHIFGADGGKRLAEQYGVTYLGALPLTLAIREQTDSGRPTVVADPDGDVAGLYKAVARQVAVVVAGKAKDFSAKFPTINISKST
jgi:ATP-binding protein involved in chromosome partitioning